MMGGRSAESRGTIISTVPDLSRIRLAFYPVGPYLPVQLPSPPYAQPYTDRLPGTRYHLPIDLPQKIATTGPSVSALDLPCARFPRTKLLLFTWYTLPPIYHSNCTTQHTAALISRGIRCHCRVCLWSLHHPIQ